jgi:chromosome partitioning protein
MSMEKSVRPARTIVVGNEKGGSGKSTVAMHVAVALMKAGQTVATIDLDSRQRSLTHYVDNRKAWSQRIGRELDIPQHWCPDASGGDESERCTAFAAAVDTLTEQHDFIVVDTPGHDGALSRLAHSMADTLITPLNDSFLDFDVLGAVDPETFEVSDASHYAQMVQEVRGQRSLDGRSIDWVVMRNRLSMLGTRNKRLVGTALQELAQRLEFRMVEGFAERMIFREFYPRGLTALDDLDEVMLGTRPTLSHATARQEVASLLNSLNLGMLTSEAAEPLGDGDAEERDRHAA